MAVNIRSTAASSIRCSPTGGGHLGRVVVAPDSARPLKTWAELCELLAAQGEGRVDDAALTGMVMFGMPCATRGKELADSQWRFWFGDVLIWWGLFGYYMKGQLEVKGGPDLVAAVRAARFFAEAELAKQGAQTDDELDEADEL